MLAVVLALIGAVAYGVSDFAGGLFSRRTPAWSVAFATTLWAAFFGILLALVGGSATTPDLAWGALGGVGAGIGTAFLYRGLSAGRMGVVAPISGVGAAVVPVLVALAAGERPGALVWLGIAFALPGIWLVAREKGAPSGGAGVLDGVLAGLGFGAQFAALGQVDEAAGFLPLATNQVVATIAIAALATAARASWVPRDRPAYAGGAVCGGLALAATGTFMLAAQQGSLTVSAILSSLYPAFTILLAALVLRERVLRAQGVGLGLCAVAVVLVAAG